ncbi:ankyrin [Hypoxylon cercidicola]|nr:ankyrin [Hypoxylon cercidicola]
MTSTTGMTSLPNELLILICEILDDACTLNAVSAVSRRLHNIANPMLYSLAVAKYPYLLCWACAAGEVGVVEKLLEAGANPNLPAFSFWDDRLECLKPKSRDSSMKSTPNALRTVYNHALWNHEQSQEKTHWIRITTFDPSDLEAYFDEPDGCYWFPLHCAAMAGSNDIVKLLVDSGAHLDPPSRGLCSCSKAAYEWEDTEEWTPLHTALCSGNETTANRLLDLGASPNIEYPKHDTRPFTALHWAALGGYLSTIRLLLDGDYGISVDVQNGEGSTPLMWALGTADSTRTMECLLEYGANIEARCKKGVDINNEETTAVLQACANGWFRDVAFLVSAGANIDYNDPSALDRCLVTFGGLADDAQTDYQSERSYEPEILCRRYEEHHKLGYLSRRIGHVDLSEDANFHGMLELTKDLIRRAANIRSFQGAKHSPLVRASAARLFPIADLLLASGSQVDHEDADGRFPLLAAIVGLDYTYTVAPHLQSYLKLYSEVYETVECLLKHGANPNKANAFGQTALMAVCCLSWKMPDPLEIMKLMVRYGADINLRSYVVREDFSSNRLSISSPIGKAFQRKKFDLCHYFVEQGAEPPLEQGELFTMFRDLVWNTMEFPKPNAMVADYDLDYDDIEINEEVHDLSIDPLDCKAKFCVALRALLEMDRDGRLAKDSQCLFRSTLVCHFPLTQRFLDSGASDASLAMWADTCLHNLVSMGRTNTMSCAQRLIDIGADVNEVDFRGRSPLTLLLNFNSHPRHFGDAGVKEHIDLLRVLLNNGAAQTEVDIQKFQTFVQQPRSFGGDGYKYWYWLDLQRELRAWFFVQNRKIIARDQPSYDEETIVEWTDIYENTEES